MVTRSTGTSALSLNHPTADSTAENESKLSAWGDLSALSGARAAAPPAESRRRENSSFAIAAALTDRDLLRVDCPVYNGRGPL